MRIVVATKPVDLRKGHDGQAALLKNALRIEQFTGTVFVFRAKRADRLKLLNWDGTGLVLAYKRLEETTFTWPAMTACEVARHRRVWPLLRRRGVLANMHMIF